MTDSKSGPTLQLRLTLSPTDWLGPGKADLMQGIIETGSISAAGRRMGMSYKRAWGLVDVLNAMFSKPLVVTSRGGAEHGGASVTALGTEVLAIYRAMQRKAEVALAQEIARLEDLALRGDEKTELSFPT